MAEAAGLVTKPHAANVSLVTMFTIHLLAALPKAGEVEFSIEDDAAITKQARATFDPMLENEGRPRFSPGRDASHGRERDEENDGCVVAYARQSHIIVCGVGPQASTARRRSEFRRPVGEIVL